MSSEEFTSLDSLRLKALDTLFAQANEHSDKLKNFEKTNSIKLVGRSLVRWNAIIREFNHVFRSEKSKISYVEKVVAEMGLVVDDFIKEYA
jgi:hypothetical protein